MASLSRAWSRGAEIRCALTEDWLEHSFGTAGTEEDGAQLAPAAAEPLIDPETGRIGLSDGLARADSQSGSDAARRGRSRSDRLSEEEIVTLARRLGLEPDHATLSETWPDSDPSPEPGASAEDGAMAEGSAVEQSSSLPPPAVSSPDSLAPGFPRAFAPEDSHAPGLPRAVAPEDSHAPGFPRALAPGLPDSLAPSLPGSLAPSPPDLSCSRGPADGLAGRSGSTLGMDAPRRSQPSRAVALHPVPPRSLRDVKLRALLQTWQRSGSRQRTRPRFATDWAAFDAALGGGLPRAAVHELLAGTTAAPTRTIAFRLALRCLRDRSVFNAPCTNAKSRPRPGPAAPMAGGWLLYLDSEPDLHPPALQRLGVPLERLLVVRVQRRSAAQWVCELALRCSAIAAVIANLPGLDANRSRRLQLAAEEHGTLGLILRPDRPRSGTFAFSRLRVDCLPGTGGTRSAMVTVEKLREATPPHPFSIRLPLSAADYETGARKEIRRARTA